MLKRLSGETGEVEGAENARPGDTAVKAVRDAIIIHSGPDGKEMTLDSSDGPIAFDDARIKAVVAAQNAKILKLVNEYGGPDKTPVGAYIPLLDQHSDDSSHRILGRVTGALRYVVRDVPKVGKNVSCAVCEITFLGADTVSRLLDGRLHALSVGIDENDNTLGEISSVIEPAAPGAQVLKKSNSKSKIQTKKLKGKAMGKKIARLEKLKALSNELKTLSTKTKDTSGRAKLAKRKMEVTGAFKKLMGERKMSPAEFKKVDLVKLSKLDKAAFDSVMEIYSGREAIIAKGQHGSTSAVPFVQVGTSEDREVKRLKAAAKKNLSKAGMKFKAEDDEDKELASDDKEDKKDLAMDDDQSEGVDTSEDGEADAGDVQDQAKAIEELQTQVARISSIVQTLIEDEKDDENESDDSQTDESEEEDKDLASDDKKDDDKDEDKSDDKKEGK